MRNAGDAEQIEVGWWPGDARYPRAAFYAYAHPAPVGFENATLQPAAAHWDATLGEFILDWDDIRDERRSARGARSRSRARPCCTPARCAAGIRRWPPAPRAFRRPWSEQP